MITSKIPSANGSPKNEVETSFDNLSVNSLPSIKNDEEYCLNHVKDRIKDNVKKSRFHFFTFYRFHKRLKIKKNYSKAGSSFGSQIKLKPTLFSKTFSASFYSGRKIRTPFCSKFVVNPVKDYLTHCNRSSHREISNNFTTHYLNSGM